MNTDKIVQFSNLKINEEFFYIGKKFTKITKTQGATQTSPIKHRAYYTFDETCPVEKVGK